MDDTRCAICGWPLATKVEDGCVRGNCSMRPLPKRYYDPERAAKEYGPELPPSEPIPSCPSCAALRVEVEGLERMLADEKQKVANLDEYVLKGVAFRDELQARIKQLEEECAMAKFVAEDNKEWGLQHEKDKVELKAALSRYREAVEDVEGMAKVIDDVGRALALLSTIHDTHSLPHEIARAVRDYLKKRAEEVE